MVDRIPTPGMEGRVKFTNEDTGISAYGKLEMADNPIENGTPYNVATQLTDETSALLGGVETVNEALSAIWRIVYPVGAIYMSAVSTNPSVLFGGTWETWGAGRVPVGVDVNDTDFNTVEKTGGSKTVSLTAAQMPAHTHTFTGSSVTTASSSHTHTFTGSSATTGSNSHTHSFSATTGSSGSHVHNTYFWRTANDAPGYGLDASPNFQDRVVVDSGGNSVANWIVAAGAHTHSVSGTSGSTSHTHAFTATGTNASNSHSHTVTASGSNASTGGGGAHTNLQPYITCYMWKRTA